MCVATVIFKAILSENISHVNVWLYPLTVNYVYDKILYKKYYYCEDNENSFDINFDIKRM